MQKHSASHLRYDFRLEMDGVFKSWAVPKGPFMNPADRRLAIMFEDHSNTYKDFEGTIPDGNFGAGSVIVWDNGRYTLADEDTSDKLESKAKVNLQKGHASFILNRKKLKGEFGFVKLKTKQENTWLLKKSKDQCAGHKYILLQDKSVIFNKTIENLKK